MIKHNKTSIIILNWNGIKDTRECLKSVLQITGDYNVIVIDNGSVNDERQELLKEFGNRITVYALENNIGYTGGVNFGITIAKKYNPDYYLLLNNDTRVEKDFLYQLIKTAETNPKFGIVSPIIYDYENNAQILYSGGDINWLLARPFHKTAKITNTILTGFVTGCSMLIKRETINKIGLFDDRFFAYFEDAAYCMRAKKAGFILVCEPNAKIYHKQSATSGKTSSFYTYLFSRNRILFAKFYLSKKLNLYYFFFFAFKMLCVVIYFLATQQYHRAKSYFKGFIDGMMGIEGYKNVNRTLKYA